MTDSDQLPQQKCRRLYGWWKFFAVLAFPFGFYFPILFRYERQSSLLDRIEQARGTIYTEPVGPNWLHSLVGEQTMRGFEKVVAIDANRSRFTDESMADLARLTDLKVLLLDNTEVTDDGLVHLQGLNKLMKLSLENTQITDAGLIHLLKLKKLRDLYLKETKVSGAGLKLLHDVFPDCDVHG